MALLTDTDLAPLICRDKGKAGSDSIVIQPYSEALLTPVGYDLRVGRAYYSSLREGAIAIEDGGRLEIRPGETVLVTTLESVTMPRSKMLSGLIASMVSQVSRGLSHVSTTVDPDWSGHLLIALHNYTRRAVTLQAGEAFCTLLFLENRSPATTHSEGNTPGRSNLLIKRFSRNPQEARRREYFELLFPALLILAFGGLGLYLFGSGSKWVAMTAAGVGLAPIITALARSRL